MDCHFARRFLLLFILVCTHICGLLGRGHSLSDAFTALGVTTVCAGENKCDHENWETGRARTDNHVHGQLSASEYTQTAEIQQPDCTCHVELFKTPRSPREILYILFLFLFEFILSASIYSQLMFDFRAFIFSFVLFSRHLDT
jgi:hypothetical protein